MFILPERLSIADLVLNVLPKRSNVLRFIHLDKDPTLCHYELTSTNSKASYICRLPLFSPF
jgi:hypothetical protein